MKTMLRDLEREGWKLAIPLSGASPNESLVVSQSLSMNSLELAVIDRDGCVRIGGWHDAEFTHRYALIPDRDYTIQGRLFASGQPTFVTRVGLDIVLDAIKCIVVNFHIKEVWRFSEGGELYLL